MNYKVYKLTLNGGDFWNLKWDEETFGGNSTTDDAVDDEGLAEVRAATEIKLLDEKLFLKV